MAFQIHALPSEEFAPLFELSDAALAARQARRQIVAAKPGTPCRVSLQDAEAGETVILLNYAHQPASSPYSASHAIFVRDGVAQARPEPDTVPDVLRSRLISVRMFDTEDMMIEADVVDGKDLEARLRQAFSNNAVAYIHLHNAKPGCFAAKVTRDEPPAPERRRA